MFAHAPEANFWAERRRSLSPEDKNGQGTVQLASLTSTANPLEASAILNRLPATRLLSTGLTENMEKSLPKPLASKYAPLFQALPQNYGTIRKIMLPKIQGSDKTIIHIQDVHMNAEAQRNIGKAVQELVNAGQVDLIALEGAFRPIDLTPFRNFPHEDTLHKVADYLLKQNKISGPIHTAFTSLKPIPPIVGIDDQAHYNANVEAYRKSAPLVKKYRKRLERLEREVVERKVKTFNAELAAFDQKVEAYREETMQMGTYVQFLANQFPEVLPAIKTFLEALDLETSLNFGQVEAERSLLLSKLLPKLTKAQTTDLINYSVAYRTGSIRHVYFYQHLRNLCERHGISLTEFPTMNRYLRYILLAESIDAEVLFRELRGQEEKLYAALVKSEEEKEIVDQSKYLHLVSKLLDFSLTTEEWKEYKASQASNAEFAFGDLSSFHAFYEEAEKRDRAMAENLLRQMEMRNAKVAVLVTGGFHSSGINEQMQDAGLATMTFTPKITKVDTENGSAYLSVFAQEKTPLEKLFAGEKLFLAKAPITLADQKIAATLAVADLEASNGFVDLPSDKEIEISRQLQGIETHAKDLDVGHIQFQTVSHELSIEGELKESNGMIESVSWKKPTETWAAAERFRWIYEFSTAIRRLVRLQPIEWANWVTQKFGPLYEFRSFVRAALDESYKKEFMARHPNADAESINYLESVLAEIRTATIFGVLFGFVVSFVGSVILLDQRVPMIFILLWQSAILTALPMTFLSIPVIFGHRRINKILGPVRAWTAGQIATNRLTRIISDMVGPISKPAVLKPEEERERYILDSRIKEDFLYQQHRDHGLFGINPGHAVAWQETVEEYGQLYQELRETYDRLLAAAGFVPERFRFYISGNEGIDAYVLKYHNTVVVSLGLIRAIMDYYKKNNYAGAKDAIAFIMAHEIVHILQGRQDIDEGRPLRREGMIARHAKTHADEINADESAMALMAPPQQMLALFNILEAPRAFEAMAEYLKEKGGIQTPFGDHPALQQRIRSTRLIAWELPTLNPEGQSFSGDSLTQIEQKPRRDRYVAKLKNAKTDKALREAMQEASSFEDLFLAYATFQLSLGAAEKEPPQEVKAIQEKYGITPPKAKKGPVAKQVQDKTNELFRQKARELAGSSATLKVLYEIYVEAAIATRNFHVAEHSEDQLVPELLRAIEQFITDHRASYEGLNVEERRSFWKGAAFLSFRKFPAGQASNLRSIKRFLDGFLVRYKKTEKRAIDGFLVAVAEAPMTEDRAQTLNFWQSLMIQLNREGSFGAGQDRHDELQPVSWHWPYRFLQEMLKNWEGSVESFSQDEALLLIGLMRELPYGTGRAVPTRTGDKVDHLGPEMKLLMRTLLRHGDPAIYGLALSELETGNRPLAWTIKGFLDSMHDPLKHGILPDGAKALGWLKGLATIDPDRLLKILIENRILDTDNLAVGEKFIEKFWTRLFRYIRTQEAESALSGDDYQTMRRNAVEQFLKGRDITKNELIEKLKPYEPKEDHYIYSAALDQPVIRQILVAVLEGISPWGDYLLNDQKMQEMRGIQPQAWDVVALTIRKIRESQAKEDPQLYDSPDFSRLVNAWLGESGFFFSGATAAENDVFLGYLGLVSKLAPGEVSRAIESAGHFFRDTPTSPVLDAFFGELKERWTHRPSRDSFFKEAMVTWPKGMSRVSSTAVVEHHLNLHFHYLLDAVIRNIRKDTDIEKAYRELVELILAYLPPSTYRNYVLFTSFVRLIVVERLKKAKDRDAWNEKRLYDFEWLFEKLKHSGGTRDEEYRILRESLELLIPNLVPDHRFSIINASIFMGDLVAQPEKILSRETRTRQTSLPRESILTFDPGGLSSQIDLMAAGLIVRHSGFETTWKDLSRDDKLRTVLRYFPRPSGIRDSWLTRILKEHPETPPDLVLEITDSLLSPMLAEQYRNRIFSERFESLPPKASFEERLKVLLSFYPKPSYARDEALSKLAVFARIPDEAAVLRSLYFRYAGKRALTKEEELLQFGVSVLSDLIGIMAPGEKREFLLWLLGISPEKPRRLQVLEDLYWINFDTLPEILVGTKRITRSMRDFLSAFFLPGWVRSDTKRLYYLQPKEGLPEDDLNWWNFLTALFDSLVPQGDPADTTAVNRREALWRLYKSVLTHATPLQREITLFNLFELRLSANGASQNMTPIQKEARASRLFLQSLGPGITKALGQALTELPGFPEEYREEFELFKNDLRAVDKLVAFGTLDRFLESEGGFSSTLKSLGDAEGFATLKGVWRGMGVDDDELAVMVKRPDVEKRLAEDIRLIRAVWEETRGFFRERFNINIPYTLVERVIEIMQGELNFDEEKTNVEALAPHVGRTLAERTAGREVKQAEGGLAAMAAMFGGMKVDESASGWTIHVLNPQKFRVWGNTLIIAPIAPGRAFLLAEERRLRDEGVNTDALWRDIGRELLKQLFIDGVVHIDLHAGNVYVDLATRRITLIDYGAVARVSPQTVQEFRNILFGLQMKNKEQINQAIENPFANSPTPVKEEFEAIVTSDVPIFGKILNFFTFLESQNVAVNKELLSLVRGFGPAGRALTRLDWTDWATLSQYDPPELSEHHRLEKTTPINLSILDEGEKRPESDQTPSPMTAKEAQEAAQLDQILDQLEKDLMEGVKGAAKYAQHLKILKAAASRDNPPEKWLKLNHEKIRVLLRVVLKSYLERHGGQNEMEMQQLAIRILSSLRPVEEDTLDLLIRFIDLKDFKYTQRLPVTIEALLALGRFGRRSAKTLPFFESMASTLKLGKGDIGGAVAVVIEVFEQILKTMREHGDPIDKEMVKRTRDAWEPKIVDMKKRKRIDVAQEERLQVAFKSLEEIAQASGASSNQPGIQQNKSPYPVLTVFGLFILAFLGVVLHYGNDISIWFYVILSIGTIIFLIWTALEIGRSVVAAVRGRHLRNIPESEFRKRVAAIDRRLLPSDVNLDHIKPIPTGTKLWPFQTAFQRGDFIYILPAIAYSSNELARVIRHEQYHKNHPINAPPTLLGRLAFFLLLAFPLWLYHELVAQISEWIFKLSNVQPSSQGPGTPAPDQELVETAAGLTRPAEQPFNTDPERFIQAMRNRFRNWDKDRRYTFPLLEITQLGIMDWIDGVYLGEAFVPKRREIYKEIQMRAVAAFHDKGPNEVEFVFESGERVTVALREGRDYDWTLIDVEIVKRMIEQLTRTIPPEWTQGAVPSIAGRSSFLVRLEGPIYSQDLDLSPTKFIQCMADHVRYSEIYELTGDLAFGSPLLQSVNTALLAWSSEVLQRGFMGLYVGDQSSMINLAVGHNAHFLFQENGPDEVYFVSDTGEHVTVARNDGGEFKWILTDPVLGEQVVRRLVGSAAPGQPTTLLQGDPLAQIRAQVTGQAPVRNVLPAPDQPSGAEGTPKALVTPTGSTQRMDEGTPEDIAQKVKSTFENDPVLYERILTTMIPADWPILLANRRKMDELLVKGQISLGPIMNNYSSFVLNRLAFEITFLFPDVIDPEFHLHVDDSFPNNFDPQRMILGIGFCVREDNLRYRMGFEKFALPRDGKPNELFDEVISAEAQHVAEYFGADRLAMGHARQTAFPLMFWSIHEAIEHLVVHRLYKWLAGRGSVDFQNLDTEAMTGTGTGHDQGSIWARAIADKINVWISQQRLRIEDLPLIIRAYARLLATIDVMPVAQPGNEELNRVDDFFRSIPEEHFEDHGPTYARNTLMHIALAARPYAIKGLIEDPEIKRLLANRINVDAIQRGLEIGEGFFQPEPKASNEDAYQALKELIAVRAQIDQLKEPVQIYAHSQVQTIIDIETPERLLQEAARPRGRVMGQRSGLTLIFDNPQAITAPAPTDTLPVAVRPPTTQEPERLPSNSLQPVDLNPRGLLPQLFSTNFIKLPTERVAGLFRYTFHPFGGKKWAPDHSVPVQSDPRFGTAAWVGSDEVVFSIGNDVNLVAPYHIGWLSLDVKARWKKKADMKSTLFSDVVAYLSQLGDEEVDVRVHVHIGMTDFRDAQQVLELLTQENGFHDVKLVIDTEHRASGKPPFNRLLEKARELGFEVRDPHFRNEPGRRINEGVHVLNTPAGVILAHYDQESSISPGSMLASVAEAFAERLGAPQQERPTVYTRGFAEPWDTPETRQSSSATSLILVSPFWRWLLSRRTMSSLFNPSLREKSQQHLNQWAREKTESWWFVGILAPILEFPGLPGIKLLFSLFMPMTAAIWIGAFLFVLLFHGYPTLTLRSPPSGFRQSIPVFLGRFAFSLLILFVVYQPESLHFLLSLIGVSDWTNYLSLLKQINAFGAVLVGHASLNLTGFVVRKGIRALFYLSRKSSEPGHFGIRSVSILLAVISLISCTGFRFLTEPSVSGILALVTISLLMLAVLVLVGRWLRGRLENRSPSSDDLLASLPIWPDEWRQEEWQFDSLQGVPQHRLRASSRGGLIRVWNADGSLQSEWRAHWRQIISLAFSMDGRVLASVSRDETIRLWDVQTHRCLATLGRSNVGKVIFGADGRLWTRNEFLQGEVRAYRPMTSASFQVAGLGKGPREIKVIMAALMTIATNLRLDIARQIETSFDRIVGNSSDLRSAYFLAKRFLKASRAPSRSVFEVTGGRSPVVKDMALMVEWAAKIGGATLVGVLGVGFGWEATVALSLVARVGICAGIVFGIVILFALLLIRRNKDPQGARDAFLFYLSRKSSEPESTGSEAAAPNTLNFGRVPAEPTSPATVDQPVTAPTKEERFYIAQLPGAEDEAKLVEVLDGLYSEFQHQGIQGRWSDGSPEGRSAGSTEAWSRLQGPLLAKFPELGDREAWTSAAGQRPEVRRRLLRLIALVEPRSQSGTETLASRLVVWTLENHGHENPVVLETAARVLRLVTIPAGAEPSVVAALLPMAAGASRGPVDPAGADRGLVDRLLPVLSARLRDHLQPAEEWRAIFLDWRHNHLVPIYVGEPFDSLLRDLGASNQQIEEAKRAGLVSFNEWVKRDFDPELPLDQAGALAGLVQGAPRPVEFLGESLENGGVVFITSLTFERQLGLLQEAATLGIRRGGPLGFLALPFPQTFDVTRIHRFVEGDNDTETLRAFEEVFAIRDEETELLRSSLRAVEEAGIQIIPYLAGDILSDFPSDVHAGPLRTALRSRRLGMIVWTSQVHPVNLSNVRRTAYERHLELEPLRDVLRDDLKGRSVVTVVQEAAPGGIGHPLGDFLGAARREFVLPTNALPLFEETEIPEIEVPYQPSFDTWMVRVRDDDRRDDEDDQTPPPPPTPERSQEKERARELVGAKWFPPGAAQSILIAFLWAGTASAGAGTLVIVPVNIALSLLILFGPALFSIGGRYLAWKSVGPVKQKAAEASPLVSDSKHDNPKEMDPLVHQIEAILGKPESLGVGTVVVEIGNSDPEVVDRLVSLALRWNQNLVVLVAPEASSLAEQKKAEISIKVAIQQSIKAKQSEIRPTFVLESQLPLGRFSLEDVLSRALKGSDHTNRLQALGTHVILLATSQEWNKIKGDIIIDGISFPRQSIFDFMINLLSGEVRFRGRIINLRNDRELMKAA